MAARNHEALIPSGAMMAVLATDPSAYWRVAGIIEPHHVPSRDRGLFCVIRSLVEQDSSADAVSVLEAAERDADGTLDLAMSYQAGSNGHFGTVANIAAYAQKIRDAAEMESLSTLGAQIDIAVRESDGPAGALAAAQGVLSSFSHGKVAAWASARDAARSVGDDFRERLTSGAKVAGLSTGYPALDALLGGLEPGRVYGIGARPKIGKSVLAANILADIALNQSKPVAVWTGEMPVREWTQRVICHRASIPLAHVKKPWLMSEEEMPRFVNAVKEFANAPIHIGDDASATIEKIEAMARMLRQTDGLECLCIDYLGLVQMPKADRQDLAVGAVTRRCKIIAKELGIPVILVFQLNRGSEQGTSVRPPRPSDARDSGSIEQDLDVMLLLHRQSHYDKDAPRGLRLDVALNRSGPSDVIKLEDRLETLSFLDAGSHIDLTDPFWQERKPSKSGRGEF